MNSRKFWSLPLVVVAALLLVGLFGAAVLAVGPTDPPEKETQIPDRTYYIGTDQIVNAAGTNTPTTVDLSDVDTITTGDQPAFSDFTDRDQTTPNTVDPVVYTAMTTDDGIAMVEMAGTNDDLLEGWWNALDGDGDTGDQDTDCSARAMRLGFSLTEKTNADDERPINAPLVPADDSGDTPIAELPAIGLCQAYDQIRVC